MIRNLVKQQNKRGTINIFLKLADMPTFFLLTLNQIKGEFKGNNKLEECKVLNNATER